MFLSTQLLLLKKVEHKESQLHNTGEEKREGRGEFRRNKAPVHKNKQKKGRNGQTISLAGL